LPTVLNTKLDVFLSALAARDVGEQPFGDAVLTILRKDGFLVLLDFGLEKPRREFCVAR
jgi:hypothetical protein